MAGLRLKAVRKQRRWTQQDVARRMGVSQTLVSFWESGARTPTRGHLAQLRELGMEVDPTMLPLRPHSDAAGVDYAQELANLGYPGFAHRQNGPPSWNPAQLLLLALGESALDRRVAEALPWLVLRYSEMDWAWVCREAKLHDWQNRLGFTLLLARRLAAGQNSVELVRRLSGREQELLRSRLAREDTYCNDGMTESERRWLRQQRSEEAAAWNLLSDLRAEHLTHAA
jgi:transcriptional regulator with XRE-family HTH domain